MAHISERAQSIPVAMDTQSDELARHLEAFERIRDKAVETVPEILEQVNVAGAWMVFRFSKWFGSTGHRRRTEHRFGVKLGC